MNYVENQNKIATAKYCYVIPGIEARLIALVASRRALDSAELRYRVGTDDLTSLLSAQQNYYSATQSALEARRDRLAAAIDLYVAVGGGF